jgi:hypothetical protein
MANRRKQSIAIRAGGLSAGAFVLVVGAHGGDEYRGRWSYRLPDLGIEVVLRRNGSLIIWNCQFWGFVFTLARGAFCLIAIGELVCD